VIKKTKFSVNKKYVLFIVEVSQIEIKYSLGHQGKLDVKFSAINQIIHVAEESLGSAAFRNTAVIKWNPFSNK
jgi:hypothetical protein